MSTAIAEDKKTGAKLNQLEQLKKFTKVVADTADFESMKEFKPQDATTNPSLVYAATQKPEYAHLLEEVIADRKKSGLKGHAQIEDICDHLLVQFGTDILEIVPGRVSTETDARLSYDVEGSINKARHVDQTLRGSKNSARARVDQNRVDLGRIESRGAAAKGGDPLQFDTAVFVAAGGPRSGSEGAAHLAVCGANLRLVQKRNEARLFRTGRSWSAIRYGDLYVLQEVRYPDRSDGRQLPERWADSGTGGMRLPDHQPGIDGRAFEIKGASRAEAHSGESEVGED